MEFLNESQSESGEKFEKLIGGILSNSNIIKDVSYKNGVLTISSDGTLKSIDTSLIVGLLQDQANITKLKKEYSGLQSIQFNNIKIDIK
ncbi:MAG: hypothetical protein RLZZ479_1570 [Bacteroidota bacterium]